MLAQADFDIVQAAIWDTWQYIAPDAAEFCEDNEGAIEMCIDADRLTMCTSDATQGEAATALLRPLYAQHGYAKVLRYLGKRVNLM